MKQEHVSPDRLLRLVIWHEGNDVSIGLAGSEWHTHADLLARSYGISEDAAVARFVEEVLQDRWVIGVARVDGELRSTWVTDDPAAEIRWGGKPTDVEYRYWSGRASRTPLLLLDRGSSKH